MPLRGGDSLPRQRPVRPPRGFGRLESTKIDGARVYRIDRAKTLGLTDTLDQACCVQQGRGLVDRLLDVERDLNALPTLPASAQAWAAFATLLDWSSRGYLADKCFDDNFGGWASMRGASLARPCTLKCDEIAGQRSRPASRGQRTIQSGKTAFQGGARIQSSRRSSMFCA
jgi:hypothetical protein